MPNSLYGISRQYSKGRLLNDSALFDACVLAQILELTGFESVEEFNNSASNYDDSSHIPDATHDQLLRLFTLSPADALHNLHEEGFVVIDPGCCLAIQERVSIPNPFRISNNIHDQITGIQSIKIEEDSDQFWINVNASILIPDFFVAKTLEVNCVCYTLIDILINELDLEASRLEQDDRGILKRYLETCGLEGELAASDDFLYEWAMQTRFQIEAIGLISKPMLDSSGKQVVLSIDGEESLVFSNQSVADFESQLNQANDPCTSQDILCELSSHPWKEIRYALTYNEAASSEVVEKLSLDFSGYVRAGAASNNNLLPDRSRLRLANDDDDEVRSAVACNLPVEKLIELANDGSWKVRKAVAESESLPPNVLERLASDSNEEVCYQVLIKNRAYPQELKIQNIDRQYKSIKIALACGCAEIDYDSDSVMQALELLAYDEDDEVKRAFFEGVQAGVFKPSQAFEERILKDDNLLIRFLALKAYEQVIGHEDLAEMSSSENELLRREIAEYRNTPYDVRVKLSQDVDQDVRCLLLTLDDLQEDIRVILEGDNALMEYYQDNYE